MKEHLRELFTALANAFQGENKPGAKDACEALRRPIGLPEGIDGTSHPLDDQLHPACFAETALPFAPLIWECRSFPVWSNWGTGKLEIGVSAGLWSCELLGPDGLIRDDRARVGLLLSAPNVDYPISRHADEETYLVISGTAEWVCDGEYKPKPPGSLIHHPSWKNHGRRTLDEPFLGAWRWSGDLDLSKFEIA